MIGVKIMGKITGQASRDKGKKYKILVSVFTWVFLLSFGWIFINCVFNNTNDLIHYGMKKIAILGAIILFSLVVIYFFIDRYKNVLSKRRFTRYTKMVALIAVFIIVLIMQILLAKSIYYEQGWDAGALIMAGKDVAKDLATFDPTYFLRFPNNVFLLWIYKYIFYLSNFLGVISYESLLVIINIIWIDLAILILLIVSKKILNKTSMIISYIIALMIFLFSPWIVVPYSDSFSMMFPILIFLVYLKTKESNNAKVKVLQYFIIGVLGLIGFQVKPTAILIIIAIIISNLIYNIKDKRTIKIYLLMVISIGIGFLFAKVLYDNVIGNIKINGVEFNNNEDIKVPMTHFLMMGIQSREIEGRGTLYGAWRQEDYDITLKAKTKEEKIEKNLAEVKNRLRLLGAGGYIKYLSNKANWMLSDGTFYYGGEGNFQFSEPYDTSDISKKIQSYYMFSGENYKKLASLQEGVWVGILFLIVLPIFIKDKDEDDENVFIMRLTITGITIFLLLFEGRSRYFINHLPFFILLSAYGLDKLCTKINFGKYNKL